MNEGFAAILNAAKQLLGDYSLNGEEDVQERLKSFRIDGKIK